MNERIKELAEQAGFDVKRLVEPYPGGFPRENFLALESFAELIVRECISTMENAENGYQDYRNQIEDGMRNHCIGLIKHKFGVEE